MSANGPEYTNEKRGCSETFVTYASGAIMAKYSTDDGIGAAFGNTRLSAASDNAVIELAEHLGENAVLLAERLQGGGLVRLVEALKGVRAIIAEGAMTGFNPLDGDWADRLFHSQQNTSAAIRNLTAKE